MNWQALIQAIIQTEEVIVPIVIHDPKTGGIAAAIIAGQSAAAAILTQLGVVPPQKPTV